ncbi:hypothetical protein Syn7502_00029 [Synechococcus sp. PCC 7502]|uniref:glycoside hydrolase family 10 protein n=1 Tax=Synechococcus sp. PCC 7502 TaxID=1173263 RepID=UPI00029F8866|nr:family 10 glycosylhydrolase [Synechococcus sp. PCC 7502]AFY72204.1 hypothetical protein Syn7502_00029 [Synechococcus sp. PCC 7502]
MKKWIKSLILICSGLAIALLLNLGLNLPIWGQSLPELRGVWLTNVDSDVLLSRSNLEQAMVRLQRLNFNTIYPTVWHEGYTLYPSEVSAKSFGQSIRPDPQLQGRDMLADAVEMGHNKGLTVIPWFEFGLMSEENAELTKKYPQWLTTRKDGSSVFVYGDHGQHRFVWLNPLRPEVQSLIVDLITEIVSKYDVDGIQLDDHFGLPAELGYDDFTIALYKQDHNGQLPPDNPKDLEWTRWRSQYITDLMVKVKVAVKAVKPKCIISLSPNPKAFSYENYLQDWHRWVKMGLLDELVIQVYRSDLAGFEKELISSDLVEVRQTIPVGIGILTGLRTQKVDMQQISAQIKSTRSRGFQGFSFFFYETLGNRDGAFKNLLSAKSDRPQISPQISSQISKS